MSKHIEAPGDDKPNPHDEIRAASFISPALCNCGANVFRWRDRAKGRAVCNGCGTGWLCAGADGEAQAMAIDPDPNAWHEAHELAALERLFEIGLDVLRRDGLARGHVARNLACRSTSTQQEFTTSLASVAGFDRARIAVEVAHVYRMVAERSAAQ